jgi:hypothetical protein
VRIAADGTQVAFSGDLELDGDGQLYVVPIDGSAVATRLRSHACAEVLADFRFTPDGESVVFQTRSGAGPATDLGIVPTDGTQTWVRLAPASFEESGDVQAFVVSADGHRVAYRAALAGNACPRDGLFATSPDGPYTALPLSGDESAATIRALTADGHVLFTATPDGLYSVASAGGSTPLLLSSLASTDELEALTVTRNGADVAFLGREHGSAPVQLVAARADAALSAHVLSAPLVAGGRVTDFSVDAGGTFAVYRADQRFNEVFELYLAYFGFSPWLGGGQNDLLRRHIFWVEPPQEKSLFGGFLGAGIHSV